MANDYRAQTSLPPGIRNNNPGNIKWDGTIWQGLSSPNNDGTFCIFVDMGWGCRALGTALVNMINKGYNTITLLINQWAPSSENNTTAYINAVSAATTLDPNTQLGTDQDTITSLMQAIINHEDSGAYPQYVSDSDIATGLSLMSNGLLSLVQAATVSAGQVLEDAQANPVPYLIGTAVVALVVYLLVFPPRRRNSTS